MLIELEEASKVLCIPAAHILKRLAAAGRLTKQRKGSIYVDLHDAADVLKCPHDVVDLVAQGKEWLLPDFEIERLYGCNHSEMNSIAGGPAFKPTPYAPVYRVSPFIAWLATTNPADRARIKEGKNGTGPKVSRQGLRRKV